MKPLATPSAAGAWPLAVWLLERWLERDERVDTLLEEAQRAEADRGSADQFRDRARCQHLLFGAVRHWGRLDAALGTLIARPPRVRLRAVLLVAGFELLEAGSAPDGEAQAAKIVHHAVDQAKTLLSPAEARLVNAVLRKLAAAAGLRDGPPNPAAGVEELARFFSHPEWLVRRWLAHFGAEATSSLLRWNQSPPPVYARWRPVPDQDPPPAWLQPTTWPGFYVVPAGHWPEVERLLAAGALYLQNPATLAAAALLDPQAGETVLDLCAAPGGKSLLLADMLEQKATGTAVAEARPFTEASTPAGRPGGLSSEGLATGEDPAKVGRVVAVDLPDQRRIDRLKENLGKVRRAEVALLQTDVLQLRPELLRRHHLPLAFPAVLLDVPCSNTGVMRHRVDVKWRLREADLAQHAAQQDALLAAGACLLEPGGRLVYSTCSLEPEENLGVIEDFLRAAGGRFVLEQRRASRPWESGCDGGSAFLLRKNA